MTLSLPSPSLSLADIVRAISLDLADVLLIRHPMSHAAVRVALEQQTLMGDTSSQAPTFPGQHTYWLNFVGEEGHSARFVACYHNGGTLSPGNFDLTQSNVLADLAWRLVIDWGSGVRSWWQNGIRATSKLVLASAEKGLV